MNGTEALAEARSVYADQAARQSQVDNIAAELAVHLTWLQQNPDAVRTLLRRQPHPTQKGNTP